MEKIVRFKIDEKSLFYGCKNDFTKGHTATVSTPINQSSDPEKWHKDILGMIDTEARIDPSTLPEMLIHKCQVNSKSENIIQDVFIFDKIMVDGKKIDSKCQFIMYIKKETAEFIKNSKGKMVENTHLGRLKLHYPTSFPYKADGFNIDNEAILKEILNLNKNYAYIVRGFEYNCDNKSLNIITSIIGPFNALLSTVFRVAKGTGKKLRTDFNAVTIEELMMNSLKDDNEDFDVPDIFSTRNKSSRYNGKKGEDFIFDLLIAENKDPYHTSVDYPTSPYDMEYVTVEGKKIYVEVKSTQGERLYFRMSKYEYNFMNEYKDQYELYVVTNVKDDFPTFKILHYDDIIKLKKEVITYEFSNR